MADNQDKLTKKQKQEYQDLLGAFGGLHGYGAILRQAVINDWGSQEVVTAVVTSDRFKTQFPGLLDASGDIQPFLVGGVNTSPSASTLGQAIHAYNTMWNQYQQVAQNYGHIAGEVNKSKLALLIKAQTSPQEFASKLAAVDRVEKNPDALAAVNQQLKLAGMKPLQGLDAFKFAAGGADKKFYDVLEAAQIHTSSLGIGAQQAAHLAKSVGTPGVATTNFAQTIANARQNLQAIGPELANQGINAAKLVKVFANPDAYVKEMGLIQQALETRKGLARPVAGTYATRGPAGGISLFPEEQTASYG